MNTIVGTAHRILILIALQLALVACAGPKQTRRQVERVAKDWCMVIRASQVIPTYPLTEDLFPGDVFAVDLPREEEARLYEERGFLPLSHHLTRLHPGGYHEFYGDLFGLSPAEAVPNTWLFPNPQVSTSNRLGVMPQVAFPMYSFQIKRGGGFNLALPIQGIPVALNFLRSSQANGNVVLKDAYSYGLGEDTLRSQLDQWKVANRDMLESYTGPSGKTNYLRVVNRVFGVRRINVTLSADSSTGAAASAGADKNVAVQSLTDTNAAANYAAMLAGLNASVTDAVIPGGSLKYVAASSRSVSLDETFSRPLMIGYLGFDVPLIRTPSGVELGTPIPTLQRIAQKPPLNQVNSVPWSPDGNTTLLRDWLDADVPSQAAQRRADLKAFLQSENYPFKATTYFESGAQFRALRSKFVEKTILPLTNRPR